MTKFPALILAAAAALPTAAMAGPYLSVGIGGSRLESNLGDLGLVPDVDADAAAIDQDFSSTDVAFSAMAGWRFGQFFAVEAGWIDFGDQSQFYELPQICGAFGCQSREWEAEVKAAGWQAFVVGFFPVSDAFDVYAKVGALNWDSDFVGVERQAALVPVPPAPTGSPVNASQSFSDDGTDLAAGLGLELKIPDSAFAVRTEFTWYDVENTDLAWVLNLNAVYSFGGGGD